MHRATLAAAAVTCKVFREPATQVLYATYPGQDLVQELLMVRSATSPVGILPVLVRSCITMPRSGRY